MSEKSNEMVGTIQKSDASVCPIGDLEGTSVHSLAPASETIVVNKRFEQYDVYIGRPSQWGNPFSHQAGTLAKFKVATRQEAVDCYRAWILAPEQAELRALIKKNLKGKRLGCWCKPLACHGDVLKEMADA